MPDTRRALSVVLVSIIALLGAIHGCAPAGDSRPAQTDGDVSPSSGVPEGGSQAINLISPAFEDGGTIPTKYCMTGMMGGANTSLPLQWTAAAGETASYAVFMIDRHPAANEWVHWAVMGIPTDTLGLDEGMSGRMPGSARELMNTFGSRGYGGPQPPAGSGNHTYEITVYALDVPILDLPEAPTASDIEQAVEGHVVAKATITGVFGR